MPVEAIKFGMRHSDECSLDGINGEVVAGCVEHQTAIAVNGRKF